MQRRRRQTAGIARHALACNGINGETHTIQTQSSSSLSSSSSSSSSSQLLTHRANLVDGLCRAGASSSSLSSTPRPRCTYRCRNTLLFLLHWDSRRKYSSSVRAMVTHVPRMQPMSFCEMMSEEWVIDTSTCDHKSAHARAHTHTHTSCCS
jgi:hypothetical protein